MRDAESTAVLIVGGGPTGLMLSTLLSPFGVDSLCPDGHVAWRSARAVDDPRAALQAVLDRILFVET